MLHHGQKAKYGHHFKNNHHENPDRLNENKEYKAKHENIHFHCIFWSKAIEILKR